jgi:ATP-binding protein involved in chromosome partitioning
MGLLSTLVDPHTGLDMVTGKQVKKVDLNGKKLDLQILLGYPAAGYHATLKEQIMAHLGAGLNLEAIRIDIQTAILSHAVQKNLKPLAGVKNIIAVASGKGGVGKSTTAVNLALALHADGARTGLLDADIYGPSQPLMLGVKGKPDTDGKSIYPLQAHGLQSMSIGYLVDEETPMIWRGPMVTGALQQLLRDTRWDQLDYLIMDLPPGTGDIQLTLAQQVPVSGAVIVTTPQDIALLDARRGLHMFEKVSVPVLGIVENMSLHVCSRCGRWTAYGRAVRCTLAGCLAAGYQHSPECRQRSPQCRCRTRWRHCPALFQYCPRHVGPFGTKGQGFQSPFSHHQCGERLTGLARFRQGR